MLHRVHVNGILLFALPEVEMELANSSGAEKSCVMAKTCQDLAKQS